LKSRAKEGSLWNLFNSQKDLRIARLPRIVVPGLPHHIVQRGNNRQAVFFADADYRKYLECLRLGTERYGCSVHAYVLMTNHVHLLVTPSTEGGLARLMQSVGRRYVRYVNSTYRRSGTLWDGRFRSALVDPEHYLFACMRYIELNPVRADMVSTPGAYQWSSYAANAVGRDKDLITRHAQYQLLGRYNNGQMSAYRALFDEALAPGVLTGMREATEQGAIMGNDRFRRQITATLKRRVEKFPHGGDRKSEAFRKHPLLRTA